MAISRSALLAFSVMAAITASTTTSAAILSLSFQGVVDPFEYSVDGLGLFGPVGGNLGGDAITVTDKFDLSEGLLTTGASYQQLITYSGLSNPFISTTVDINGFSQIFYPTNTEIGEVSIYNNSSALYSEVYATTNSYKDQNTPYAQVVLSGATSDILNSFTNFNSVGSGDFCAIGSDPFCEIQLSNISDLFEAGEFNFGEFPQQTSGYISQAGVDTVTMTLTGAAAAVPEPATWALMLGGFGLVGGVLRRRSPAASIQNA